MSGAEDWANADEASANPDANASMNPMRMVTLLLRGKPSHGPTGAALTTSGGHVFVKLAATPG
jgi:hypothetical protein